MQAIRVHQFGGPDVLQYESIDDPHAGPGEVVVRLGAAGVNPVETYIRSGAYARKPPLPYTPGTDGAGTIEAVGPGVTTVAPGDRVYLAGLTLDPRGSYAERIGCPVGRVRRLADRVSFAQGAALGVPYATAYRALFQRAAARPGEHVLVHGASGAVGSAAVQFAVACGLRATGTAGTAEGLAIVAAAGGQPVDHGREGYAQALADVTGGRGFDVIVENLANVNLDRDLGLLAPRGRVVVVGNRGRIEIDPRQAMARDLAILGMTLWNATEADLAEAYSAIDAGLAAGTLSPVVGRTLPLAEAAEAHRLVLAAGARGKIVLTM